MRSLVCSVALLVSLAACAGSTPTPSAEPPEAPAAPAPVASVTPDVSGAASAEAAASPEKCKSVDATPGSDRASCLAECDKLDATAPEGSRCIPPRAACASLCNQKYPK